MYTQFFGNYLLNNGYITSEQLVHALEVQKNSVIKLGVLAIHAGLMTSAQVEEVHIAQTHQNKRFGEIAIENGFLSTEQVNNLLSSQKPDYLMFSQALNDLGYMSAEKFEEAFSGYRKKYKLSTEDFANNENKKIIEVIQSYNNISNDTLSQYFAQYLMVLFNNIIRFIGKDFTPHPAQKIDSIPKGHIAVQKILGEISTRSFYVSDQVALLTFASRYAEEEFPEIDEYVEASVEDFLNLNNGIFITTMSNEYSIELTLEPPCTNVDPDLNSEKDYYCVPVTFSFGTVNFIIERTRHSIL